MTGIILAVSRAIGETAPLLVIGALVYVPFIPEGPRDQFTTLPIQIFNWTSHPQTVGHVIKNRFGKWIWSLEHHTYLFSQFIYIHTGVDICIIQ